MSDKMVLLAIFGNPVEAELARAQIEGSGIRAALMGTTSGDLFAGMGVGFSNVQLLVPEEDLERAARVLDALDGSLSKDLPEERKPRRRRRKKSSAIQADAPEETGPSDIRAAAESPAQTDGTPDSAPLPAERDEAEPDDAEPLPAEEDDDEREDRPLTWTPDDIASRAFRAAIFGYFTCGALALYVLWLVVQISSAEGELSPAGSRKATAAVVLALLPALFFVLLVCGLVLSLAGWLLS